jgi:diguanylate cyclase (GGDEF)-like protein
MQPRDHRAAACCIFALGIVAAVVTIAFAPIAPANVALSRSDLAVVMIAAVAVGGLSWFVRYLDPRHVVLWAVGPLLPVAIIVGLDYVSSDSSVAAQVFFFFPMLYGASQLPRHGALTMTFVSVAGEVVVVAGMSAPREAITEIGYVGAAVVTVAVLLIRAGERQEQLVAKLVQQAAIDPLTGLVTRRVLDEAAQSAMTGAALRNGTALLLLDVDNFKQINDRYGHPAGDDVLIQLARLLTASSRADDVVSRMGGDEIAVLLPGCGADAVFDRAERLIWEVRAHEFRVDDSTTVTVSVSVGLAHAPTHAENLRTLYAAADMALYAAKRAGRNRVSSPVALPNELDAASSRAD